MATTTDTHRATDQPAEAPSPTPDAILELGFGFFGSKALLSAVELGLFSELTRAGSLDGETLRERLGLHPRGSADLFDALVALGMLERDGGEYRNTSATDLFLDRSKPSYIGGILEMANARLYPFWADLTEGLRTGLPQNEIKSGGSFFEVLYRHPARLRQFLHAMTGISLGPAVAIAQKFPWIRYGTVLDVGCAAGALPVQLLLAHDHLRGAGFDLPPVGPVFDEYVGSFGLDERLRFQAGDFFVDPLPPADVLTMGHILHDWDIDAKRMLLAKAYEALPEGGALIVYEFLIDDERRENAMGLLVSLNMLIETEGGFDYTGADCAGWMRDAGFRSTYVERLVGPTSMVVGIK